MHPLSAAFFAAFLLLSACHAADRAELTPPTAAQSAKPVAAASAPSANAPEPAPSSAPAESAPPSASTASASPSASASAPVAAKPPGPGRHYVVAAVGDSLTDPRSHGGGYLDYVKARCPSIEIDNFGRGGTMVNQMHRHFDEEVQASSKPYTHLIVFGGVNDLYSDLTAFRTPAKIEADLGYMYAAAKARNMVVVALTVAPWGGFTRFFNPSRSEATHSVNAWIRAQPAQGRVDHVVDAFGLLSCGDPDVLCERFFKPFKDGIHFGPGGHRLVGEALYQAAFSDCS